MENWIYLSHSIKNNNPMYGNKEFPEIAVKNSIEEGDSSNSLSVSMINHTGTHIDFPRHFKGDGKTYDDFLADFWVFDHVLLVNLYGKKEIGAEELSNIEIPDNTELILLYTGSGEKRGQECYWKSGPIFKPEVANVLRQKAKKLRVVGVDTLSISSYKNREIGRLTHKAFLADERPILILEDMFLADVKFLDRAGIKQAVILPLPLAGADGAPCNVIAKISI